MSFTMSKKRVSKKSKRWDEILVVSVLVLAALSILLIISSYISVTGRAAFTAGNVVEMLDSHTIGITGEGVAKCDRLCMREGKSCILAWEEQNLVACNQRINGEYSCACSSSIP